MAKHIIFFVLAVLACAHQSQAGLVDPNLVPDLLNTTVEQINKFGEEISLDVHRAEVLVEAAVYTTKNLVINSLQRFKNQFDETMMKVSHIIDNEKMYVIKECNATIVAFRKSYESLIAQTEFCMDQHVQVAISHLDEIIQTANVVSSELKRIAEEATFCTRNAHGFLDLATASICTGNAVAKASAFVAANVPHVAMEMTKLSSYVGTLPPRAAYCTAVGTLSVLLDDFSYNLDKVNRCLV